MVKGPKNFHENFSGPNQTRPKAISCLQSSSLVPVKAVILYVLFFSVVLHLCISSSLGIEWTTGFDQSAILETTISKMPPVAWLQGMMMKRSIAICKFQPIIFHALISNLLVAKMARFEIRAPENIQANPCQGCCRAPRPNFLFPINGSCRALPENVGA